MLFDYHHVLGLSFSPDDKYFICGFSLYSVHIWDFETKKKLMVVDGGNFLTDLRYSFLITFSPNGQYFAMKNKKLC
jgi:WD40 repeat protein